MVIFFIQNILNNCGMSNIWLGQNSYSTVLLSNRNLKTIFARMVRKYEYYFRRFVL